MTADSAQDFAESDNSWWGKIFESEVLRFQEHNQVCFPKNQTELKCSEGPGACFTARTTATGWETWFLWDAPERLQNRPADSSTDNSSHKHSRFKLGRVLSMQAEKKGNSARIPADFTFEKDPQRYLPVSLFCAVPFYNGGRNRDIHQI